MLAVENSPKYHVFSEGFKVYCSIGSLFALHKSLSFCSSKKLTFSERKTIKLFLVSVMVSTDIFSCRITGLNVRWWINVYFHIQNCLYIYIHLELLWWLIIWINMFAHIKIQCKLVWSTENKRHLIFQKIFYMFWILSSENKKCYSQTVWWNLRKAEEHNSWSFVL